MTRSQVLTAIRNLGLIASFDAGFYRIAYSYGPLAGGRGMQDFQLRWQETTCTRVESKAEALMVAQAMAANPLTLGQMPKSPDGIILMDWIDPPTGLVGPGARLTGGYVYQVFGRDGRKHFGGTTGPDTAAAEEYARRQAATRDMADPAVTFRSTNPADARGVAA